MLMYWIDVDRQNKFYRTSNVRRRIEMCIMCVNNVSHRDSLHSCIFFLYKAVRIVVILFAIQTGKRVFL